MQFKPTLTLAFLLPISGEMRLNRSSAERLGDQFLC
jgi:hypothetical protein